MLAELEAKIFHTFKKALLLELALSHKSQANELRHLMDKNGEDVHNERLEFLGDAVLQLCISHLLWTHYASADEGRLSKLRSALVNETALAEVARGIDLGTHIRLGRGEQSSGGRNKNSILSSTYEALLGAIYLDAGFPSVMHTVERHFQGRIEQATATLASQDFKSVLQERVQSEFRRAPVYKVVREEGPDHVKSFEVSVGVGRLAATGCGRSKKEAEQSAAKAFLLLLDSIEASLEKSEVLGTPDV